MAAFDQVVRITNLKELGTRYLYGSQESHKRLIRIKMQCGRDRHPRTYWHLDCSFNPPHSNEPAYFRRRSGGSSRDNDKAI